MNKKHVKFTFLMYDILLVITFINSNYDYILNENNIYIFTNIFKMRNYFKIHYLLTTETIRELKSSLNVR